jgi:hypothetical protein
LLESGHEGALVFEDDIYVTDMESFTEIVSGLQQDQDIDWVRLHLQKQFQEEIQNQSADGLLIDDPMPWGFAAYYVSRRGAMKMLEACRNIDAPIDWLPPLMREHGLLDSKTVTKVVVDHHAFEGDESQAQGRSEFEKKWYKLQKTPSTIWTSPVLSEDTRMHGFVSRLNKVNQLKTDGLTVLRGVFDEQVVEDARKLVMDNRSMLKNTRPTSSSGHLAAFHRFPVLEPLHGLLTGNPTISGFFDFVMKGDRVRSIGLSDITVNRSQPWHNDLLRGRYKHFLDGSLNWKPGGGGVYKVLLYLQDGASLQVVKGSHARPISLDNDGFAEPGEDAEINPVTVYAGDVVIMDIRCAHRGADESAYASGQWDDDPRILVSTVLGGENHKLTGAMEKGNFARLLDWTKQHP